MTKNRSFLLVLIVGLMLNINLAISAQIFEQNDGFFNIDVDDPNVKEMAEFVTNTLTSVSYSGPIQLVKIVKARLQILDDRNYKMTLKFQQNYSKKEIFTCQVAVADQPRTNTRQLTNSYCSVVDFDEDDVVISANDNQDVTLNR